MDRIDVALFTHGNILAPSNLSPSLPEGEGAALSEPALPPLHPLRPRGRLGG